MREKSEADIFARVRLYGVDEGHHHQAIVTAHFGCPLIFEGEAFDCRILLGQTNETLVPGQTAVVPIKFLKPELVKPRLKSGSRFKLWESGEFADGEVLEVFD